MGVSVLQEFPGSNTIQVVSVPNGSNVLSMVGVYQQSGLVQAAEPDYAVYMQATPNDPSFPLQWGLSTIQAPLAWNVIHDTGANIIVATIDTGIDYNHSDLNNNLWKTTTSGSTSYGYNSLADDLAYDNPAQGITQYTRDWDPLDDNGHGTHVAGIIGAVGNNGLGVSGVCWNTKSGYQN